MSAKAACPRCEHHSLTGEIGDVKHKIVKKTAALKSPVLWL